MPDLPSLHYDFIAPARIAFGWGRRREAAPLASSLGRRALLVTGSKTLERTGTIGEIESLLRAGGIETVRLAEIGHEPEVRDVDAATDGAVRLGLKSGDFVLAIGGGSALDLGKAVAAMATNRQGESVRDYLEGVGRGLQIVQPPLPLMAMPTTAGTGTEATKNAVISSYDPPFKKSLRSDLMMPRLVLVDPELTVSVPPDVTAHTGMDAITQLIESYVSCRARPIPRALCLEGLDRAVAALEEAVRDGTSRPARGKMAQAALLSGMALANSGLGLAHGVAAALGVYCRVPHGLACAVMLPAAMRANREVARTEFARLAPLLTGREWPSDAAAVDAAIEAVERLAARVGIPRSLSEIGVTRDQLPDLVAGSRGNSMSGNPRDVSDDELRDLLEAML